MPSLPDHLDHDTIIQLAGYSTIGSPTQAAADTIRGKAEHDAALLRARVDADEA